MVEDLRSSALFWSMALLTWKSTVELHVLHLSQTLMKDDEDTIEN